MKSPAEIIAQQRRIDGLRDRYRLIADRRDAWPSVSSGINEVGLRLLNRSSLAALGDYMAAIDGS